MRPWRLLLGAGSVALALGAASGCSDWPPGDRGDGGSNSVPGTRTGYCGGTPQPCSGLSGAQCEATGCDDLGGCLGSGVTCPNERSFSSCGSRSDCYWSPSCTGVPVGCLATTQGNCEAMPGCVWTPAGGGSGGAGSGGAGGGRPAPNCPSLDKSCTTSANCDCNMQCLVLCNMCPSTCAKSCRTDTDCVDTGGNGFKTPYCVKFTSTTWACSPNPPAM
jgi:hypothetical protein